uniref:Interferon lambda 1 n=1 Tax=Catagonus wagneri TaxID=51154 RepID=A0A8C3VV97_9CETA
MAATWLLVLVAVMLDLARAGPIPTFKPTTTRKGCHVGRFQSPSPRELKGFKKAKDALEDSLSLKNWSCSSRLFPRTQDLRQLQVWEYLVALEAELDLTLKVLGAAADSSLGVVLDQPLRTLHDIHFELQACIQAQPTAGSRPWGCLDHWLHQLQGNTEKESQGCLEAYVTFSLFHLPVRDLRSVASGDPRI